jgi:hypothetical protein
MKSTADVTGGKPIAVLSQSNSGVSVINPLDAFYDIHERKREVLSFYFVPDTTRDNKSQYLIKHYLSFVTDYERFVQLLYLILTDTRVLTQSS